MNHKKIFNKRQIIKLVAGLFFGGIVFIFPQNNVFAEKMNLTVIPQRTGIVLPPGDGISTTGNISGPGIDCGNVNFNCAELYDEGTVVTLTATPNIIGGYSAGEWIGVCEGISTNTPCVFTMDSNKQASAVFPSSGGPDISIKFTTPLPSLNITLYRNDASGAIGLDYAGGPMSFRVSQCNFITEVNCMGSGLGTGLNGEISPYDSFGAGIYFFNPSIGSTAISFKTVNAIPGTYYYRILAYEDSNAEYRMIRYSSPIITVTVIPGSDFTASTPTPTTVIEGNSIHFSSNITNIGTFNDTNAVLTNLFQVSTSSDGSNPSNYGAPTSSPTLGEDAIASAFISLSAGTYYMRVCADSNNFPGDGTILEAREDNNCSDPWTKVTVTALPATAPTVTTASVTNISQTTAKSGGNVISDGGSTVTVSGIVWSTSVNPTTVNNKTTDGWAIGGPWVSSMTGLSANTNYYVRAYATNSVGTSYGNELSFTTTPVVPTSLSASCPLPGTKASLSWSVSTGATYYTIKVNNKTKNSWNGSCNGGQNAYDVCQNTTSNSFEFTSEPGDSYDWWLNACNSSGCSPKTSVKSFTCAVNPNAPVLDPIKDKTVNEGTLLSFTVSATDPDGDPLTYSAILTGLPVNASFDPVTRTFSWTPTFAQAGSYPNVNFSVSDGTLSDNEAIKITVINTTPKPDLIASAPIPTTVIEGLITFYSTITNIGTVGTGKKFKNVFQVAKSLAADGTGINPTNYVTDETLTSLSGNNAEFIISKDIPLSADINKSVLYYMRVCADFNSNIPIDESNENNNCNSDIPWIEIVVDPPGSGSCSKTHYNCSSGNSVDNKNLTSEWTWTCEGSGLGVDRECKEPKKKPGYIET